MAVLDGAIANVALPTIASDLHASPASSIWIVNAYQIAIVVSLLSLSSSAICSATVGSISAVWWFYPTSLFCALSDSLHTLTLARIARVLAARR
jgi:DHA2 family multidrug resistance protein-like MFS transporter